MAEDLSVAGKEKMSSLTTSKKTTTVEAAFDSDESDWSEDDVEYAAVAKPVTENEEALSLKNPKNQASAEVQKKSPPLNLLERDAHRQDFTVESGQSHRDSFVTKTPNYNATTNRRDSVERSPQDRQHDLTTTSPYFVKETNSSRESAYELAEDAIVKVKRQERVDDDDDDWDEESYVAKKSTASKEFTRASHNDKVRNEVFQPPASGAVKRTSTDGNKPNAVDWSETYSDGGSEVEEIGNDVVDPFSEKENLNEAENLPAQCSYNNSKTDAFNEGILKSNLETPFDGSGNQRKQSIPRSPATTSTKNILMTQDSKSLSKSSSLDSPINTAEELYASGDSRDNIDSVEEQTVQDNEYLKPLPSSSSAAQLFRVAPSPPPVSPDKNLPSKSTFRLAASNPCLDTAAHPKKNSKPSSAKHLLTRLFSSDGEKSSKTGRDVMTASSTRKTTDPIPLSTLLLKTSASDSEKYLNKTQSRYLESSDNSLIPARYFPPVAMERQENYAHNSNTDALPLPGQKRKGFLGKMKKTLGISSKGRKMRASESMSAIVNTTVTKGPTMMASDMNIVRHGGERVIAVPVSGRTADDVIMDLLKEGKMFLESTTNSPFAPTGGGGDELVVVGQEQMSMDRDHSKRLPPSDKFVTVAPLAGSSKLTKSDNSLVNKTEVGAGKLNVKLLREEESMSSYYCSKAIEGNPNRQVIYNILDDFCCVLDKTFGENDRIKSDNGNLFSEIDQLRAALECCEASKRDLERQIQELQDELRKLQLCLEEECQARANLEGIVCELKAQLDRQDELLAAEMAQKAELLAALKQLETDNWNLRNQLSDFGAEKDEFTKNFKGFEGTKNKCVELQIALAECCEKHDLMQREILDLKNENNEIKLKLDNCVFEKNKAINDILQNEVFVLRQENNDLKKQLDTCQFEKNKLINEMERMRQEFSAEKAELEAKICELLDGLAILEKTKGEVCKKTNSMLAAHHEEMDNLKAEADSYKARYEQELRLREDLEQKLRLGNSSVVVEPSFRSTLSQNVTERSNSSSLSPNART